MFEIYFYFLICIFGLWEKKVLFNSCEVILNEIVQNTATTFEGKPTGLYYEGEVVLKFVSSGDFKDVTSDQIIKIVQGQILASGLFNNK